MVASTGTVPCYRPGSADHILATGQLDGVLNLFIAVVAVALRTICSTHRFVHSRHHDRLKRWEDISQAAI